MNAFVRRQIVWFSAVATTLYIVLQFVLDHETLLAIYTGAFFGLVLSITLVFVPAIWRAWNRHDFDNVSQFSVGIACTWGALILSFSANVAGVAISPSLKLLASYLAIVGGILHITAPGTVENKLQFNRGMLAMSALLGAIIAFGLVHFRS